MIDRRDRGDEYTTHGADVCYNTTGAIARGRATEILPAKATCQQRKHQCHDAEQISVA